jgi:hypothetical protein
VELPGVLNWPRVGTDDHVTQSDTGLLGGRISRHVHYQKTVLLLGTSTGAPFLWQLNFLYGDPKMPAPNC